MTNDQKASGAPATPPPLVIRNWSFLSHSDLVIRHSRKRGSLHWSLLAFLLCFSLLLAFVAWYFLLPAAEAAKDASFHDKEKLRAVSALLLSVLLFILFVGLSLPLRLGQLFFPRPQPKPTKTEYIDAWAESGKRLQPPPPDAPADPE